MTDMQARLSYEAKERAEKSHSYWMGLHAPTFLKRVLPAVVMEGLRALKGRVITRGLPRNVKFIQSSEDAAAAASISIIIPIHDAPGMVRRCLASLEKYAAQAEVILIDDASKLAKTRRIISRFAKRCGWRIVRNETSRGHSAACKTGAELSTRPYLCLLNSDTVVTPWCWRQAKRAFEQDQAIAVAGPSTSIAGTDQTHPTAFRFRYHWNENQIWYFASQLLGERTDQDLVDLPWISGFAFFIRRSLWTEAGGFDPNLPDYGNEVELCARLRERGYRTVWVRNSYIHHFGKASYLDTIGDEGIEEQIRNAKMYIKDRSSSA